MYTSYFGLTEKPFTISPDPRYLYMSDHHKDALAHLLYGISSDGCIILLTGEVGTGKTTVCRCLLEQLPEKTDVAIILNPRLEANDLLKTICEELQIVPRLGTTQSIQHYIQRLNEQLLQSHGEGRTTVVIIDEAQNLDAEVIEQLRLLTNLETNTDKLLRIILVGQPELRDILSRPDLSQVNQRITGRYHLAPLKSHDAHAYVKHRIRVAGNGKTTLFSKKAIQYATKVTGGIPRKINLLCDRALLGAYAEGTDHVDHMIIQRAVQEAFPEISRRQSLRAMRYILVFLLVVGGIAITAGSLAPSGG